MKAALEAAPNQVNEGLCTGLLRMRCTQSYQIQKNYRKMILFLEQTKKEGCHINWDKESGMLA